MENVFPNKLVMFEKCNVALEKFIFMYGKVTRAWQCSEDDMNDISTKHEAFLG